jgi:hypothetical protein
MISTRRLLTGTLAALVVLSACRSTTAPDQLPGLVADPSLDLDAAHVRWVTVRPFAYTFEFVVLNAMVPSTGYVRVAVSDGRVVSVKRVESGEPLPVTTGLTLDQLWDRLIAARAAGESLSELQFSQEGIPIQATVGTFANDGGLLYRVRGYAPNH